MSTPIAMLMAILLGVASGCASPCEQLADRTCRHAGTRAEICTQMRAVAQGSTSQGRVACGASLEYLSALDRNR